MKAIGFAAAISVIVAGQAVAQDAALPASIQVSQPGDANLSCADLTAEMARMDQVALQAQAGQAGAQSNAQVTGAVAGAATSAALYSGALGRSFGGFGGLFASGAQNLLGAKQAQEAQQSATLAQDAQMRRTMLAGVHTGKGCSSAQPAADTPPAAAPGADEPAPSYAPAGAPPSYAPAGAREAPGG